MSDILSTIAVRPQINPQQSSTSAIRSQSQLRTGRDGPSRVARAHFGSWGEDSSATNAGQAEEPRAWSCPDGTKPNELDQCPTWLDGPSHESYRRSYSIPKYTPRIEEYKNLEDLSFSGSAIGKFVQAKYEPALPPDLNDPNWKPYSGPTIGPAQPPAKNTMEFDIPGHESPHTHQEYHTEHPPVQTPTFD